MVRADVITTAGALLTVLAVNVRFASAFGPANHMRALATTSTSATECATEFQACNADSTCLACAEAYDAVSEACAESVTSTDACGVLEEIVCCASSGCENNVVFAASIGAWWSTLSSELVVRLDSDLFQ